MPGLIEKIVISGSDNADRYLKRIEPSKRVSGGYCIQATPFELSQIISAIRAHSAPRSMLCVGVDSAGTERILAEELGIMSIRFTGESEHPKFEANCKALESNGIKKAECKTFDLITVFGESALADFEAVKGFIRQGTVVVVFDTGMDAMQPECRLLWHKHRNIQNTLLHTHEIGTGVFMVKNMIAMGAMPEVPVPEMKGKKDDDNHRNETNPVIRPLADAAGIQTAGEGIQEALGGKDSIQNTRKAAPGKSPKGKPGRKPKVMA